MKSPDSTNRPVNGTIHIPALRNFNAGMCFFLFSVVSGLEMAWCIENGGLMLGKNSISDCLDHFSHSIKNSGEPNSDNFVNSVKNLR
jgi:hypothetical protein